MLVLVSFSVTGMLSAQNILKNYDYELIDLVGQVGQEKILVSVMMQGLVYICHDREPDICPCSQTKLSHQVHCYNFSVASVLFLTCLIGSGVLN